MAIYHFSTKVISRNTGRTAVGAAAYMSCSAMTSEYDGVHHDYTRKAGLGYAQVFVPDNAPRGWLNRENLWNAVEQAEISKDSRLARQFIMALPVELDLYLHIFLVMEYIQDNFVKEGMCADVCIHNNDPNNPHVHIMTTVRPLNPDGTWQHKTEKEYLCMRNGEERGFTAAEYKAAQADGWEKQYPYFVGKKKVYMTPSGAEEQGLERASKNPKCTRFGRQNPISERWNSEEQLLQWREKWAECVNRHLEQNHSTARVDHRSHVARGMDEQPTIHEGVVARAMEKKGVIADRCDLNMQIKDDNSFLWHLKVVVRKLMDVAQNMLPTLARALETIRRDMVFFRSHIHRAEEKGNVIKERLYKNKTDYDSYLVVRRRIAQKLDTRKAVRQERDKTPLLNISRRRELSSRISGLTKDIESLKVEEQRWIRRFGQQDSAGMKTVQKRIEEMEKTIQQYGDEADLYIDRMDESKARFAEMKQEASRFNQDELIAERLNVRREIAENMHRTANDILGQQDMRVYSDIVDSVDAELGEGDMVRQYVERKNSRERLKIRSTERATVGRGKQEEV